MAIFEYNGILSRGQADYYVRGTVSTDGTVTYTLSHFKAHPNRGGGGLIGATIVADQLTVATPIVAQRLQDLIIARTARHFRCAPRFVSAWRFNLFTESVEARAAKDAAMRGAKRPQR